MDNKFIKAAIILVLVSFLLVSLVFAIIVLAVRGPSFFQHPSKVPACTQETASAMAADLIKNSSTFTFDGINGSIKQAGADSPDNGQTWQLSYTFETAHPGCGNRTGQVLAQSITEHTAQFTVSSCKIVSAVCDNSWDLLSDRPVAGK